MSRRHGRHQIHLTWTKRELLRWTLAEGQRSTLQSQNYYHHSTQFLEKESLQCTVICVLDHLLPVRHVRRVGSGQSHLQLGGADVDPDDLDEVGRQEYGTLAWTAAHVHRKLELFWGLQGRVLRRHFNIMGCLAVLTVVCRSAADVTCWWVNGCHGEPTLQIGGS